ncbi:MAG: DinB family protein [Vicinamibacterales bacterium]
MADLNGELARGRAAVHDMIAAAEHSAGTWTTPRASGKWSPSQIVEHVARALDESAKMVDGAPTLFPTLPKLVRPAVRSLFYNRVLRDSAFPKAKTNKAMNPASGPETPTGGRARLEGAFDRFERACRSLPENGVVVSTVFGRVSVESWARFQALHVRHHTKQIHGGAD